MDPLLETPARRVLRALHRDGPVNMRRFTEASGHTPKHAKTLREKMAERGWIVVNERALNGTTNDISIDLTTLGREIVSGDKISE